MISKGSWRSRYAHLKWVLTQNVLAIVKAYPVLAQEFHRPVEEIEEIITRCRRKLLAHRTEHRPRPHLDNKV
jgi:uncharacterized protein YyaL (SSP411 family)